MTSMLRLPPVIGVQSESAGRGWRREAEPIFRELAVEWEAEGRLVPGCVDEEWVILARRYPWPH
ncbi:hypothetical protein [Streptomyces sp. NPDC007172]|uniref:hypothetical protein n=1 Tax=Streptomyces sp. NPDC007172 TaxID=3364776 RepID=UPI0036B892E0